MIADNIEQVQSVISDACARVNRDPASVTLVAVSKTHPAERLLEAAAAGLQHFGENRVEESAEKIPQVMAHVTAHGLVHAPVFHMIGHLQSRKARDAAELFPVVHSVDTVKLAMKLNGPAVLSPTPLDVLLEMNVSGEASKGGFAAHGWETDAAVRAHLIEAARAVVQLPGLRLAGLMTMAPIVEDMEAARPVFRSLHGLRGLLSDALGAPLPMLSMGMSDDYPVAIEEGATHIRIGRAIFGERAPRP
jgi:pyridoxal phosphate enzyme (YggS family)